ncbi:hypothetical protein HRbin20_01588 [bacterium HR20]|nr:hypothetical protein HRbin20_01588 [bacterium HR20]
MHHFRQDEVAEAFVVPLDAEKPLGTQLVLDTDNVVHCPFSPQGTDIVTCQVEEDLLVEELFVAWGLVVDSPCCAEGGCRRQSIRSRKTRCQVPFLEQGVVVESGAKRHCQLLENTPAILCVETAAEVVDALLD